MWLARWHGVEVALKELHGANSPRSREEMLGEACTLASLRHPCVIAIYGVIIGQVSIWFPRLSHHESPRCGVWYSSVPLVTLEGGPGVCKTYKCHCTSAYPTF